ncbi:hypothetical protein R5R35_002807 [Gryllus longicercus]|uniref:Transcription termination factor 2 n=1 Tax=Gryllus longicercus TaxID=2509291 RepID=A0AAN9V6N1_9ORTH
MASRYADSSDDSEDEIESVEIEEDGSKNSGNNNKMNEENDQSDIQVLKIENRVDKSKVSDIRSFITVQKPQVTQSFSQVKGESEDEIESVEIEEDGSKNSGNNNKMNEENDQSDIQVLKIENRVDKSKVSDIRSFITVQKPQVTQSFSQLKGESEVLTRDIAKLKNVLKNIDVNKLPDNGMKLQMKLQESEYLLKIKERELKKLPMDSTSEKIPETTVKPATSRLPIGFGVKALQTQIREKTLTEEAISDLHGSISTCPTENVLADAPLALRSSVELMIHQRHALAWLLWRETQRPPAGILADDMGLGKTLTMISLVLKCKEKEEVDEKCEKSEDEDEEESDGYPLGGTLIVCPASLLMQWEDEIKKHCRRGVLEVEIHHGSKREENARQLARNDIVITTYSIVRTSANKGGKEETVKRTKRGVLHRVRWRRIILDEAHVVRNHKSQQSLAVCLLMGRKRWALTGTPIHNKELDLYALLKFLRCSPFDDYNVWRRWVDNKNSAGIKRLNTVINAIMLRRTKALLQEKGELGSLPEKNLQEIFIQLEKDEFEVYTKVLWFSKTLFAQFLQQRADKEMLGMPTFSQPQSKDPKELIASNPELANMFNKMQQMHDIKTHDILVLLLRLRQICVHPGLIKAMLDEEAKQSIDDVNEVDGDILSKMGAMSLDDHSPRNDEVLEEVLKVNNPVFDLTRMSSKMKAVFKVLHEKVINTSDKGIIVSQWTSMLNIIYTHLVDSGVKCDMLSGAVPVKDRMEVVKNFNSERGNQVLLLSLTAGGVGLNLTGGNHLLLIDLHWNPQLESQAFDRIYRVGQKKPVYIYKFICQETIEERIKVLQDKKLSLAAGVLTGTVQRNVSKLTLEDLKSLFSM